METINIKPTWKYSMSIILEILRNGKEEDKAEAAKSLMILADELDKQNAIL